MRPTSRNAARIALIPAALVFASHPVGAQEYPAREIRSICNFAAGSGADILVRYYSDRLARLAGKPVLVENKVGAQGNIATEYVARAKPDGYTIMITPASSTLAAARHIFKQLSFDPVRDFTPVTTLAKLSFAIAVDAKRPIHSIGELTEYLKKKPGDGNYATGSNTGLVAAELYKEMAGLKSTHIPYKAAPNALSDLLGGEVDFMSYDVTFLMAQARAGRVRMLPGLRPHALVRGRRSGRHAQGYRRQARDLVQPDLVERGDAQISRERRYRSIPGHIRIHGGADRGGKRELGSIREARENRTAIGRSPKLSSGDDHPPRVAREHAPRKSLLPELSVARRDRYTIAAPAPDSREQEVLDRSSC